MCNTNYKELMIKSSRSLLLVILTVLLISACGSSSDNSNTEVEVPVTPTNNIPIANAGTDQTVDTNTLVALNASGSTDSDGDTLTYRWSIISMPSDTVILNNSETGTPSFTPDKDGEYLIYLVVNDGTDNSVADSVIITSSTTVVAPTLPTTSERTYAIVDTNQILCYNSSSGDAELCDGSGYDADYSGNQPNYTISSDGLIVTDNVTGLIWQQSSDINEDGLLNYDDKLYQDEAVIHCENLILSGRDDWRLPSTKEAYSLILFSGKDASDYQGTDTSTLVPFIDSVFDWAFGDLDSGKDRIIDGQYASTTLYESTTMNGDATMFGVNYVDGRIKGYPTETKEYYVRCVADNADYGINDFIDNNDDTISDNATGLMWQQNDNQSNDWDDAIAQCESATTASYDDWRLPNVKELQSIVDYSVSPDTHNQAAINAIFNSTSIQNEEGEVDWGYYWASTTHVSNSGDGSNATYVSFGRALGYMQSTILDVHGAGSQRSNDKLDVSEEKGASFANGFEEIFYYKGPQGDILRESNFIRCVRDLSIVSSLTE